MSQQEARKNNAISTAVPYENQLGSTVIVGAGIAGLASAVVLKELLPDEQVIIIEKPQPQTNTLIAGQRYRAGKTGVRRDGSAEIATLLAEQNGGVLLPQMVEFGERVTHAIDFWEAQPDFVRTADTPEWFGPQWGSANAAGAGRGKSVTSWFREAARQRGVHFIDATVSELVIEDDAVRGLQIRDKQGIALLEAGQYVLANGSMSGRIYESTNRTIHLSGHELLLRAGLPLVDNTLHMVHPFGNSDKSGRSRIGCFETDMLAGARVFLNGLAAEPVYDAATTNLLAVHHAHYHFPEIVDQFSQHGNVVKLEMPDGSEKYAKVAYHHGLSGIRTSDGVSVEGVANLFAVGDAAGLGFWTNSRVRLPGFALSKCLNDAALLGELASGTDTPLRIFSQNSPDRDVHPIDPQAEALLRHINTRYVLRWMQQAAQDGNKQVATAQEWQETVKALNSDGYIASISSSIAAVHEAVSVKGGEADVLQVKHPHVDHKDQHCVA